MVPDLLVYFDVNYLSFEKLNPCEISKPLHLWQLLQAKRSQCKCSEEVKKLVCNTMPFSCWANHIVKNVLLFFSSEFKTSYKKGGTGNKCPFPMAGC